MDAPGITAQGYCTSCRTPTPTDARFCPGCGRQLLVGDARPRPIPYAAGRDVRCPHCDALLQRDDLEICPYCAKRIRPSFTRRPGFRRAASRVGTVPARDRFCMYCGTALPAVDGTSAPAARFCPTCGRDPDGLRPPDSVGGVVLPGAHRVPRAPTATNGQCNNCGLPLPFPLNRWPTGEPRVCIGCGFHLGGTGLDGRALSTNQGRFQRKDQTLAAILSLVVPGLGQVYNGRLGRGIVVMGLTAIGLVMLVLPGLCVWGIGVWDSHRMARDMNLGNLPYAPTPKAKMAAFVALPLLLVLIVASLIPPPPPPLTPVDFDNVLEVPYDDLFRYNQNYVTKTVGFHGKIEQISKNPFSDNEYVFRVSTRESEYIGYSGDVIWVNYQGDRYLEGDVIGVVGVVRGLKEYTAIFGNSVMIPEVDAAEVTLISKSGST